MRVWSLGGEDPLKEGMTTHFSILAWRIPWTEEPGGPPCTASQRIRHDWSDSTAQHIPSRIGTSGFKHFWSTRVNENSSEQNNYTIPPFILSLCQSQELKRSKGERVSKCITFYPVHWQRLCEIGRALGVQVRTQRKLRTPRLKVAWEWDVLDQAKLRDATKWTIEKSIFFSLTHFIRSLDSKLDTNIFFSESTKSILCHKADSNHILPQNVYGFSNSET